MVELKKIKTHLQKLPQKNKPSLLIRLSTIDQSPPIIK